jgi:hypothetical protein
MFTVVPASIVNVTPLFTVTGPEKKYGLFALVHVVSELIMPVTVEACAMPKCTLPTKVKPPTRITTINISRANFPKVAPTQRGLLKNLNLLKAEQAKNSNKELNHLTV